MDYKGHLTVGVVAFVIMVLIMGRWCQPTYMALIEWLGLTLAGSLFPDIDIKSKGQKYFYWCIFLVLIFLALKKRFDIFVLVSLLAVIPLLAKHRGLFHRVWVVVGLPLLLWYGVSLQFPDLRTMLLYDVLFFIGGAVSHLWADMGFIKMISL